MSFRVHALASAAVAAIVLGASGCYKATFIDPGAVAGEEHEEWTDFFLFGLVGSEEYDVRRFCQGPVARVRTGGNAGTAVVTMLTLGIYAPRKVYVTCAAGPGTPAPQAVMVEEEHGQPVRVRIATARGERAGWVQQVAPGVWSVRRGKGGAP